jgi:multidrug resistance efflux pump
MRPATDNFVKVVQRVPVRIALPPQHPLQGLLRPGLSVKVAMQTQGAAGAGSARIRLLGGAEMATAAVMDCARCDANGRVSTDG